MRSATPAVPPDITLIEEYWIGNVLCLDDCLELYRRYSSPLSTVEAHRVFAAA